MAPALALLAVVSISLLTVLGYAGAFAVAAIRTARQRTRCDPLADELDQFLDGVLRTGTSRSHRST